MKIAFVNVITRTPTKGVVPIIQSNKDAMAVRLAKDMCNEGVDVDLFVSDLYKANRAEQFDFPIFYLRTFLRRIPEIPFVPSLILHVWHTDYDIIFLSEAFQWSTVFAVIGSIFKRQKPCLLIWQEMAIHQKTLRKLPSKFFYRIFLRFFLDFFITGYIPRSESALTFLLREGVKNNKIYPVISHGIANDTFFPEKKDRSYLFAPSRLVIYDKGLDVLLSAIKILMQKHPQIKLIIQGTGPDEEKVRSLISKMGLENTVDLRNFHVTSEDMRTLYQGALATIIASRRDNVVLSSMESALCGTPVVMSDAIDNSSDFNDNIGGFVFKNEDSANLAKIISEKVLLSNCQQKIQDDVLRKSEKYKNRNVARLLVGLFGKL